MSVEPFAELLIFMYEKEKKIEIIRQILCEIPDFEPYHIFKMLDQNQRNFLDSEDIFEFLSHNGENLSKKTIESTIIDHFANFEGKIYYKNFLKMVLPQENSYLRKEVSQREIKKTYSENLYMEEIEYSLSKIIKEEISTYSDSEDLKNKLRENKSFELIRSIDKNNSGFIDFDALSNYFQNKQYPIQEDQIVKFLRRVAKSDDLKVPKREFSNFLITSSISINKSPNRAPLKNIENDNHLNFKENHKYSDYKENKFYSDYKENKNFSDIKAYREKPKSIRNQDENDLLSNTLRLETADFQYSENQDDQNSIYEINESPICRNDSTLKNFNLPLIYIESQESLLDLLSLKNGKTPEFERWKESSESKSKSLMGKPINDHDIYNFKKNRSYNNNNTRVKNYDLGQCEELIQFFYELVMLEKKTEKIRQDLALRPDFNLLDFFVIFDKNQKGYLSDEEVENMFHELKIKASNNELILFLRKFDKFNTSKLKFSDFLDAFTPAQMEYADLLKQRKPINMELEFTLVQMFSNETLKFIFILLQELVNDESSLERMRNTLNYSKNIDVNVFFEAIDNDGDGIITFLDLKDSLQKSSDFNEKEMHIIFNRFDEKKRGKLTLDEFLQEINPKLTEKTGL